jgi:hypothetical protein
MSLCGSAHEIYPQITPIRNQEQIHRARPEGPLGNSRDREVAVTVLIRLRRSEGPALGSYYVGPSGLNFLSTT